MFTPVSMRSANAYKKVAVETSVDGADSHQLIGMLYAALQQSLSAAKYAIQVKDIPAKGNAIGRAVRLLEEGLKASLNEAQGGELAANLRGLYDYCIVVLSEANLRMDERKVDEVISLIEPVAQAWSQIRAEVTATAQSATRHGA